MSQPRNQKQSSNHTQTSRPGRGRAFIVMDSDEDAECPTPHTSNAVSSQVAKPAEHPVVAQRRGRVQPLFLDSDEDDDSEPQPPNDDNAFVDDDLEEFNDLAMTAESSTLKTQEASARQTRSLRPIKRGTKKVPVIIDDESDDGATFKGFRGKKRGAR